MFESDAGKTTLVVLRYLRTTTTRYRFSHPNSALDTRLTPLPLPLPLPSQVCQKLGWKSPKTRFDILPIVVSANGQDPEFFDLPDDIILRVHISHPK